jgi:phosphoglycerate kinase
MNYPTLRDLPDVSGQPVLVRLDLNVPVANGKVVDDFRIKKALPTLNLLREKDAKIIILSHIEGGTDTLKPVYEYLKNTLSLPVTFCEDCIESGLDAGAMLQNGELLLCENIRLYDGEKKNDEDFAKKLSALGKYFVNDAFSVSHRKHASVVGIPKFLPSFIGLQFEEEITQLSKCFNPPHPFVFILGGAKFDTKIPLVEKFLPLADTIFIGGALANDFFKAEGLEVGASLVSEGELDLKQYLENKKIVLPVDVVVTTNEKIATKKPNEVLATDTILDAGEETIELLKKYLLTAKCVLWNGPLGNYEKGFTEPTMELARLISVTDSLSIVGGGDTLATIAELHLDDKFSFISTGGGAMLDFLAHESLPGLDVLSKVR